MTLIVAIPAKDGIVIASDSQVTAGAIRWQDKKIKKWNDRCLWAASGELALIQRVEDAIQRFPDKSQPLNNIKDSLSATIKQSVTTLIQQDFRTQFFSQDPDRLLALHPGDFVFAEYGGKPNILHLQSHGTNEWINKSYASGSGALFAYALLQKYQGYDFGLEKAALLAYKVIEESIQVGSFGIGPPIDVWKIPANEAARNLTDDEIAALSDSVEMLRKAEIEPFLT